MASKKLQNIYDKTDGNQISPVGFVPSSPITSRFVAPWDTSGWYYVCGNLKIGSKMYSNTDITVKRINPLYFGSDYILTYDSKAEGFLDTPGIDFFVETDTSVSVALQNGCIPDWTEDWVKTNDDLISSDDHIYDIYSKEYGSGSHISIPGISGDFDHFIVIVRPLENMEPVKALPKSKVSRNIPKAYALDKSYRSYIVQVFNNEDDGHIQAEYKTEGCCMIEEAIDDKNNKYLVLQTTNKYSKASISKAFESDPKGRIVFESKVSSTTDTDFTLGLYDQYMNCCAGVVFNKKGNITDICQKNDIKKYENGRYYTVKIVADTYTSKYDVWIDHRKAACGLVFPVLCDTFRYFRYSVFSDNTPSKACIDNIYIYDDTETYVLYETINADTVKNYDHTGSLEVVPLPFPGNSSIMLKADDKSCTASRNFPSVKGIVSVETKVKVTDESFALVPEITDSEGKAAVRVAMYKNNLYASNGSVWERIYEGLTPWMYYPCDNWFCIKAVMDTKTSTYDLYVDGAKRACGFSFIEKAESIGRLVFSCGSNSACYINKLMVYDCADFSRGVLPNAKVFDIKKAPYNAVGDGKTSDQEAIQKAIDDAAYTGGTVYVHDGIFLSGTLTVHSDMTLFIDRSATILGTQDHSRYRLVSPGISLCAIRQLGRGLIYGEDVSNVRITGGGTLDGNGTYRYKMNDPIDRLKDSRPDIIYITYSKDLVISDLDLKSPAFWTVVPLSSGNITIKNLNLDCMNTPNRDGIDPVDCHDMTITNCNIMAGDDGLCFKSSDKLGCYNIDVSDMMVQSLASGIKFGTDTYYCLKNVHICDCSIKNVNRCGISLETVDGAEVDNVLFERIDMTDVGAPIYITVGARNRLPRGNPPLRKSRIRNVIFRDIRFEKPYPFSYTKEIREIMVIGQNNGQRIEDVKFENMYLSLPGGMKDRPEMPVPIDAHYPEYDRHGSSAGYAFTIRYAKNITFDNCNVTLDMPDVRNEAEYFDYID